VFAPVLACSLLGKAQARGLIHFGLTQIRDFSQDKHRTVDDKPYGGGEGMLLRADVLYRAWESVAGSLEPRPLTILMSPQGQPLTAELARDLSRHPKIILVCGHYEGVDERFIEEAVDLEVSIGDYVLTGGELPALVLSDAIARWIPGVVGKQGSVANDSFENGVLKYPQYTRPAEFRGHEVPQVLLSGDHQAIRLWRENQSLARTEKKRPDLLVARSKSNK
jgi:tRNA (guanine37-N1)-methyltransferase